MRTLTDIQLGDRQRAAITAAAIALRAAFPIDQIILFGSTARGEAGPESDIDLLVLTKRPLTDLERRDVIARVFPIQLDLDVLLSPLVVATDEWFQGVYQALPIRKEVDRDGVAA